MAIVTTWNMTTGTFQLLVNGNGYVANNAGTITFLLPTSPQFGDMVAVTGINNASGWRITQNANQRIWLGTQSTTVGTGGSLACTDTHDLLYMLCVFGGPSSTWVCVAPQGNLTVV